MDLNSCLYECQVMHRRYGRRSNIFRYPIFMFFLDLGELHILNRRLLLFGKERSRPFSFYAKDHFTFKHKEHKEHKERTERTERTERKGMEIRQYVEEALAMQGIDTAPHRIMLLTHLRLFGYIFNPVSFYYCYDREEQLFAIAAEVNNTFREQKIYVIPCRDGRGEKNWPKRFYVSPFIEYDSDFHFRFQAPGATIQVGIDSVKKDQMILKAVLKGERRHISDRALAVMLLRYPLITLRITLWIHLQALKLYLWKIPYFSRASSEKALSAKADHER